MLPSWYCDWNVCLLQNKTKQNKSACQRPAIHTTGGRRCLCDAELTSARRCVSGRCSARRSPGKNVERSKETQAGRHAAAPLGARSTTSPCQSRGVSSRLRLLDWTPRGSVSRRPVAGTPHDTVSTRVVIREDLSLPS